MKNMFTVKHRGLFWAEEEGAVYSEFIHAENKHTFYDSNGNILENYSRPSIKETGEAVQITDPDFFEEIGEGFYKYTTHDVTYDIDGEYGLFGIKYNNGKKLTEEIYNQVGRFCNGLCAVSVGDDKWGCIDTTGKLVIPYHFCNEIYFNQYGVAAGNHTLIDRLGNEIPDTRFNCIDDCGEDNRYFVFSRLTDQQLASIDECGTAPDITVNIFDTKNRAYVVKDLPEDRLDVCCFHGEPEVIAAAVELLGQYDSISLLKKGTILCNRDGFVTVYDYYQ